MTLTDINEMTMRKRQYPVRYLCESRQETGGKARPIIQDVSSRTCRHLMMKFTLIHWLASGDDDVDRMDSCVH